MSCSNNNEMVAVTGLCQVAQGNELLGETSVIQSACMLLLAIGYSSIKEKSRWNLILTFFQ